MCLFGCGMNAHCEWGFCECNAGTIRKYGRCVDAWSANSLPARPQTFDPFKSCTDSKTCMSMDMNLVCNTNLTIQGTGMHTLVLYNESIILIKGKCECRRDMKWNKESGECQVKMKYFNQ